MHTVCFMALLEVHLMCFFFKFSHRHLSMTFVIAPESIIISTGTPPTDTATFSAFNVPL